MAVMNSIEDVENYFNSCGFGILHFTRGLEDTYVLIMNQNYNLSDRVYLTINYTVGRDEEDPYKMVYLPVITDVCSCDEKNVGTFESKPEENMNMLMTITDRFDFDDMPDEILQKDYDSEFEQLIDYIRLKADLNFQKESAEDKAKKAFIRKLKVQNMSILDDILGDEDYEEIDNEGLQYNDIVNKQFKYKNKKFKVVVTEKGKYLFFMNGSTKIKEDDRDLFIARIKGIFGI